MTDLEARDWMLTRDSRLTKNAREDARQRLLERYLWLVPTVVSSMAMSRSGRVADRDDFIQTGTLGLMSAMERFEPLRGVEFSTFASRRIRGSVLDYLRELDWLPRSYRRDNPDTVLEWVPVYDGIRDGSAEDPLGLLEEGEKAAWLALAVERLPERERRVVQGCCLKGKKLGEVAVEMDLTESRVCQIRVQALERLRKMAKQIQ